MSRLIRRYNHSVNYIAIFLITWQLIVSLGSVHEAVGGAAYPDLFRAITSFVEAIFMLDLFNVVHLDCWVRWWWWLGGGGAAQRRVITTVPLTSDL